MSEAPRSSARSAPSAAKQLVPARTPAGVLVLLCSAGERAVHVAWVVHAIASLAAVVISSSYVLLRESQASCTVLHAAVRDVALSSRCFAQPSGRLRSRAHGSAPTSLPSCGWHLGLVRRGSRPCGLSAGGSSPRLIERHAIEVPRLDLDLHLEASPLPTLRAPPLADLLLIHQPELTALAVLNAGCVRVRAPRASRT